MYFRNFWTQYLHVFQAILSISINKYLVRKILLYYVTHMWVNFLSVVIFVVCDNDNVVALNTLLKFNVS